MFLTAFRRSSRARGKSPRNLPFHRCLRVESLEQRTLLSATFLQEARLHAAPLLASPAEFGASVAISGDLMVVGAPYATVGGNLAQGAAYVFTETGSTWTQTAELTVPLGKGGDEFGTRWRSARTRRWPGCHC